MKIQLIKIIIQLIMIQKKFCPIKNTIQRENASAHRVKTSLLLYCYLLKLYVGRSLQGVCATLLVSESHKSDSSHKNVSIPVQSSPLIVI